MIKEQRRACEGGSLGCARQPGATVCGVELENIRDKESKLYICGGSLKCRPPKSLFPTRNSLIFQEQHPLVLETAAIPAMRAEWRHVYSHVTGMLW